MLHTTRSITCNRRMHSRAAALAETLGVQLGGTARAIILLDDSLPDGELLITVETVEDDDESNAGAERFES